MIIRPATQADQAKIQSIVRAARINPFDLSWRRFLVADEGSEILGVGQIKPHKDGSRELASLAVLPAYQGKGVGSAIIQSLLRGEKDRVYLFCTNYLEGYYTRFGFQRVKREDLTPELRRIHRMGNWMAVIGSKVEGRSFSIIAMRRDMV